MGRTLPNYCEHDVCIDWGDFGSCQGYCERNHADDPDNCPDSPGYEACPQCSADPPSNRFYRRVIAATLCRFGHAVPDISTDDIDHVRAEAIRE